MHLIGKLELLDGNQVQDMRHGYS